MMPSTERVPEASLCPRTVALVQSARAGDANAIEELFQRCYGKVQPYVSARLGTALRRDFDSVDVLQDAFMVALRKLRDLDVGDGAGFVRWLRCIVEHQITDKAKWQRADMRDRAREVRMNNESRTSESGIGWEPQAARTGPLEALLRSERSELIARELGAISDKHQRVIELRLGRGLPWSEVALQLDKPSPDAARMLFANALRELMARVRCRLQDD